MVSNIFILSVLLLLLFLFSTHKISVIYAKSLLLPLVCICFILLLILFSNAAVEAAARGIDLWLRIVFPSLFPFFVVSQLLGKTGFIKAVGILMEPIMRPLFNVPGCSSFALAMGVSSGYPTGAKITAELLKDGMVSKLEAERLLTFTNNSGPLFIIGAVAVGMFGSRSLGFFLLGCHIAACITVGLIFRYYGSKKECTVNRKIGSAFTRFQYEMRQGAMKVDSLGSCFGDAIRDSIGLILNIGGFIIFFSVIIRLLTDTGMIGLLSDATALVFQPLGVDKNIITACLSGFFEITTGASLASKSAAAAPIQQLTAVSMIIGWAGISVHSQVISIVSKEGISIKPYLCGKLLQGIFAAIYTWLGSKLLFHQGIVSVFSQITTAQPKSWYDYFTASCRNVLVTVSIILLSSLLTVLIGSLRKLSTRHRMS